MSQLSQRPQYEPPFPPLLPLKGTFAYKTLTERLPIILTKSIDSLSRSSSLLPDTKSTIIAELVKLKHDLQTNKPISKLETNYEEYNDKGNWNYYIDGKKWFDLPWLVSECLVYRKVAECFSISGISSEYDWFREQKEESFNQAISNLSVSLNKPKLDGLSEKDLFYFHLVRCLWGNQNDLSLNANKSQQEIKESLHSDFEKAESHILANDKDKLFEYFLVLKEKKNAQIDIILDNVGSELLMDMCFAEYLVEKGFKVVFHVKVYPWFFSDVTEHDFHWTINQLTSIKDSYDTGLRWKKYLDSGKWELKSHLFYNTFHPYAHMQAVSPDLYNSLPSSSLLIFKGDLNYRKLVYDCEYPFTTPFNQVLRYFNVPVLAVRTCKADVVVGLDDGVLKRFKKENFRDLLVSGKYGVIQFYNPLKN